MNTASLTRTLDAALDRAAGTLDLATTIHQTLQAAARPGHTPERLWRPYRS